MYAPLIAMWDIVPEENWKPRKFLQNIVLPRVDHLFLLSSNQQNYIEKRWGCGAKTSVVYQHIDAEFYRPEAPAPDGPIFAIGDDAGRDFDTLIRAVNSLDVHLVAKTRKHLIDLPDRRARIDQISERLSHTDLRKLYADAKFVVVPTYQTENVSGVGSVLESMAMGKAIIVTDNPPLRDFFVDGETAIVVPAGDEAALREAIVHLNDNPEKCLALGQGGRAMVEKKFSNPVLGTRLAQQIRTLVESKSRESTCG